MLLQTLSRQILERTTWDRAFARQLDDDLDVINEAITDIIERHYPTTVARRDFRRRTHSLRLQDAILIIENPNPHYFA